MQTATERRDPQQLRVPLDDVLIDLSPAGYGDYFAADGVNLGRGGLLMRSSILPDVGTRLDCRFESPVTGRMVQAECEVVWAEPRGNCEGEFGLRFVALGQSDRQSIEALVTEFERSFASEESKAGAVSEVVRLRLDGVAQPLDAELRSQLGGVAVVEQELPFLKLGKGVTLPNGSSEVRGELTQLALRVENDVPRLVLTVSYEDTSDDLDVDVALDAVNERQAEEYQAEEYQADDNLNDDTLIDGDVAASELETLREKTVDSGAQSEAQASGASVDEAEPSENERPTARVIRSPRREREASQAVRCGGADELLADVESAKTFGRRGVEKIKASSSAALTWMKARMVPAMRAGFARLLITMRALFSRLHVFVAKLRNKNAEEEEKVEAPKRVQGAPRKQTKEEEDTAGASSRLKGKGRYVLLAAAVFGAVMLVSSMSSGDSEGFEKDSSSAQAPQPTPEESAELDSAYGELVAPNAEPGETPSDSPYANEQSDEMTEGSDVFEAGSLEDASSYTLRMSLPPESIRGQATANGIRVVIAGSNAIDGARRIAAADDRIATASIQNHGNEAELRMTFADGVSPSYRVSSRSSSLVIAIGD